MALTAFALNCTLKRGSAPYRASNATHLARLLQAERCPGIAPGQGTAGNDAPLQGRSSLANGAPT